MNRASVHTAAALATLVSLLSAARGDQRIEGQPIHLLKRVADVRQLSTTEAELARPVEITGTVTALSGWKNSFFVQDSSGGISVDRRDSGEVQAGDEVRIVGVTSAGLFAPVVLSDEVRVLGHRRLPVARPYAYGELIGGRQDSQWIEVRGIVHSARIVESWGRQVLFLNVDLGGGNISVRVHDFPPRDFSNLVDAAVRVRGVCGTNFNERRQFIGLRLFVPDLTYVRAVTSAPTDPFAVPTVAFDRILQFSPLPGLSHRVKISGTVTYQKLGQALFLQHGREGILVQTSQPLEVDLGARVEAVGFIAPGNYSPALEDAIFRKVGSGDPPVPINVAPADVIQVKEGFPFAAYDGTLVQLEGQVVERLLRGGEHVWLVRGGSNVFEARLQQSTEADRLIGPGNGSRIRVTGVCVTEADQNREPRSFSILLRSVDDLDVAAPWSMATLSLWLIVSLAALGLGVLVWILCRRPRSNPNVNDRTSTRTLTLSGFRQVSRIAGLLGSWVGLAVLFGGWASDIAILRSVLPGYADMKPNTALGLLLAGGALWLDSGGEATGFARRAVQVCAGIVTLTGALTVIEYASGWNLHIDDIVFRGRTGSIASLVPARMSLITALNLLLLGSALMLRFYRRGLLLSQYLVITSGGLCLLNLVAYLYGIQNFYGVAFYTTMAIHTSVTFVLLCVGVLFSRPDAGFMANFTTEAPGGVMARRLLPAALVIPAALGWLRWQGQLRGYYDTAFGVALFASANIVIFTILIWTSAGLLNRLDRNRRRAEENLRESERRLRRAILEAPIPMILHSEDNRMLEMSRGWTRFSGYTLEDVPTLGDWMERAYGERARMVKSYVDNIFNADETVDSGEFTIRSKSGELRIWDFRTTPLGRFADGKRVLLSLAVDITDHKRAEDALRESETRYRTVVESLPQMVWTCRPDGRCDYLGRRWVEYTGVPEADQVGFGWLEQIHPEDRLRTQELWQAAVLGGDAFDVEHRIRNAAGEYGWFRGLAVPLRDASGAITKWFGSSTDIQQIKLAESALRKSEASFRQLADAMPQIVWTAQPDGHVDYYNRRWFEYTSMTSDQSEGWGWTRALHPDDVQRCVHAWKHALERAASYEIEYRLRRASDGAYRWHLGRALPVRDGEGRISKWFGTYTDINDHKRTEEALHEMREQLEARVSERTAELENANRAKDLFLANMSHELRTPLNAIIGFTGTLLMKLPGPLTAGQSKQLQTVQSSAKHLLSLISDLLDLAKIQSGKVTLSVELVVLQAVVEEVSALLSPRAQEKGLKLKLAVPQDRLMLRTDRRALSQILLNLTSNAIKFTERGEVGIALSRQEDNGRSWTLLTVNDTGIGIRLEDQSRLFQAFSQVDSDGVRRQGGTGLGLHLSRKLAELLGGQITFKSEFGKGSTFTLSLPES